MTPTMINGLLASRSFGILARVLLTFVFWSSGLAKVIDFGGAVAEMERYGVMPTVPMAIAVIIVQLGGCALVISGRWAWLGAGALGVFTALTIPIAHAFWTMTGEAAFIEMMFTFEHVSLIGGLVMVAILHREARVAGAPALAGF
ncbi:DoxX family protein [Neorhizobium galegae]|uniref:DoxX family protein n=1 Tax=Neorhizobium galegae TaxID=399 RepID=UPI0021058A04|nr:DoxX family protein [Neorhizobium galegae]MCQ1837250.1 DoxX family protein [Neorhizobium galegae]UIY29362.1 DoxX family protein [Neorhizobium galegae]